MPATCGFRAGLVLKAAVQLEQMGPGAALTRRHCLGSGREMDRALFLAVPETGSNSSLPIGSAAVPPGIAS